MDHNNDRKDRNFNRNDRNERNERNNRGNGGFGERRDNDRGGGFRSGGGDRRFGGKPRFERSDKPKEPRFTDQFEKIIKIIERIEKKLDEHIAKESHQDLHEDHH